MTATARYQEALINFPTPGGGGAHPHELRVANLGIIAGLSVDQIFTDIRRSLPQGKRRISDHEITDAINKALSDHQGGTFTPRPRPVPIVQNGAAARKRIIDSAKISDEADLWEASPLRLWDEPKNDAVLLLETLYEPTDWLFIGDRVQPGIIGETIRTVADRITFLHVGGKTGPHIIPNPLSGQEGTTKDGKSSFRSDNTVLKHLYCVVEFDDLPCADQIRFWSAVVLPIVALIDSGGKSIHAWLDVQKMAKVETPDQWTTHIECRLYDQILTPMGVDTACSNPSRLSRLPGHYREEKGAYQRLLWLSPEGRPIC
ncbi:MAG: hypothetical protein AB1442_11670 [Nitrospirota bacterium]